ncbi:hypothetical protein BGW36DRAFT_413474 [Talaromyces proteolyticus]|uniref:Uncharacterized protein n=1 Tax=Talaromyces proteolyticus TaxID=1131652 RepID=A0AAD4L5Q5_9EURO|nr:uncharacterized protein BGW36DRAFT_413474 [Talaromyces proteolyticus]KAH8705586.1 hypothetical protein BGW36DRAFT_413474 [Talaromyces proteolyticus]
MLALLTISVFQPHAVYLHAIQMMWFKNLNVPKTFGFLKNQHEESLIVELIGFGTVGLGYKVPNYHVLPVSQSGKIYVLAFDYCSLSARGPILDALTVVDWTMKVAVTFANTVIVMLFVNLIGITLILLLSEKFFMLFNYLRRFILDKWLSKDRIVYKEDRLTIISVQDDYNISCYSMKVVFWYAVNALIPLGISYEEFEEMKLDLKVDLGAAGSLEEILETGLHDVVMSSPVVTMAVMRIFEVADLSFTC